MLLFITFEFEMTIEGKDKNGDNEFVITVTIKFSFLHRSVD